MNIGYFDAVDGFYQACPAVSSEGWITSDFLGINLGNGVGLFDYECTTYECKAFTDQEYDLIIHDTDSEDSDMLDVIARQMVDHAGAYDSQSGQLRRFAEYCKNNEEKPELIIWFGINTGGNGYYFSMPVQYDEDDAFKAVTGVDLTTIVAAVEEQEEEVYGTDYFVKLERALSKIIRGLANFVYNMVMLGIKATGGNASKLVTIDDLVFDRFEDTSLIAFYDNSGVSSSLVSQFKDNVSEWFNNFQGIALITYVVLLLYVGLRILISVGGKQQSKYKEMLVAWGQGLILLVVFPLAIKYAIEINHALVQQIESSRFEAFEAIGVSATAGEMKSTVNAVEDLTVDNGENIGYAITANPFNGHKDDSYMAYMACTAEETRKLVDAIVYCIMVFQFIMLLIAYYKRLMQFAFLMAIYPIVMIMYPIDKVGDGNAQSFGVWSREIMMNIFMQVFHAIVYVFVIGVVYAAGMSGSWLLAIVGITFLFKGEELLRTLLGPGETQTAQSLKKTAGKTIAAFTVMNKLTDKITDNVGHAASAVRFSRRARAEKNYANALKKLEKQGGGTGTGGGSVSVTTPGGSNPDGSIDITSPGKNIDMKVKNDANRALAGTGLDSDKVLDAVNTLKNVKDIKDPQKIADAMSTLQKAIGTGKPEVNKLLQGSGLSGKQVEDLSKLQAKAMGMALSGDKSDGNYSKTLETINKDLEIGLSAIFPNLSTRDKKMFKHGMILNMAKRDVVGLSAGGKGDPAFATFDQKYLKRQDGIMHEIDAARERARGFIDIPGTLKDPTRVGDRSQSLFATTKGKVKLSNYAQRQKELMRAEMGKTVYLNSAGERITKKEATRIQKSGGTVTTRIGKYHEQTKDWSHEAKEELAENFAIAKEFSINARGEDAEQIVQRENGGRLSGGYKKTAYTLTQVNEAFEGLQKLEGQTETGKGTSEIMRQEFNVTAEEGIQLFDELVGATFTQIEPDKQNGMKQKVGKRQFRKALSGVMEVSKPTTVVGKTTRKAIDAVKDYAEYDHKETDIARSTQKAFDEEAFESEAPMALEANEELDGERQTRKTYKKVMARVVRRDQQRLIKSARTNKPRKGAINVSTPGGPTRVPAGAPADSGEPFEYYDDSTAQTSIAQVLLNEREGISDNQYATMMANERRDMLATVMEDLRDGALKEDGVYIGSTPTLGGMTAEEHEAKAKEYRRRAFEEATRTVGTTTGVVLGATIGAPLGVGVGAEDSLLKEALVGAVGGAVTGDYLAERAFGEQRSEATIRIRNPYDGSISEVTLERTGFDAASLGMTGGALNRLDTNKVYSVNELQGIMSEQMVQNVHSKLADTARQKRRKIEQEEAQSRINVYRDNLLSSKKDKNTSLDANG